MPMTVDLPAGRNRLGEETSPYLRQHKDNPVQWWPWTDAAFIAARVSPTGQSRQSVG